MLPYQSFRLPQLTTRLWVQDGSYGIPFDPPIRDQTPLQPYVFRRGGLWQTSKILTFPVPFDSVIGDRPIQRQGVFRPGGFWQTQKIWLQPAPFDAPIGDRPLLPQYRFRPGGLWKLQRIWTDLAPIDASIIVVPPATIITPLSKGGGGLADRRVYVMRRYPKTVALILAGEYDAAWAMLARESKSIGS